VEEGFSRRHGGTGSGFLYFVSSGFSIHSILSDFCSFGICLALWFNIIISQPVKTISGVKLNNDLHLEFKGILQSIDQLPVPPCLRENPLRVITSKVMIHQQSAVIKKHPLLIFLIDSIVKTLIRITGTSDKKQYWMRTK